jgi:hypothetical protein
MRQIKYIAVIFGMMLLAACIKQYDPVIDANTASKLVVSGRITDTEGWQDVYVSLTSPVGDPAYIPLQNCIVNIRDDKGNIFPTMEFDPGRYRAWITQDNLVAGTSYHVIVVTPDREIIVSAPDQMSKCPPVDTVYYAVEDLPTTTPGLNHRVVQYYADLNAPGDYSRFYKWEVDETWEYHSAHSLEYYYDGFFHTVYPPDSTNKICWITVPVNNVFTVSTKNLAANKYSKYPLHYVDGKSNRLLILYSLLLHQYALSEGAYNYWEQLRINSNDQGGLYEKQPIAIKGNLSSVTNPGKEVLGYFYAASTTSHRYFYHNIPDLDITANNGCQEDVLGRFGWSEFAADDYPVFFYYNETGALRILSAECIDCRKMGGTTTKPDFWPN